MINTSITFKHLTASNRRKVWLSVVLLFTGLAQLQAQRVPDDHIIKVADAFVKGYLCDMTRVVSALTHLEIADKELIAHLTLSPEGWLLMSRDYSANPVLAFSLTGSFFMPEPDESDNRYLFLSEYAEILSDTTGLKSGYPNSRWNPEYYQNYSSRTKNNDVTVEPLITVTWGQGAGWNRFCPEDEAGPGGRAYVGCVAVAMAQSMSVYKTPVTGTGSVQYYHNKYGYISADFSEADYRWSEMSNTEPDDFNALFLYHCAVSIYMNFNPDGSGAQTDGIIPALRHNFFYSNKNITYHDKKNYTTTEWVSMLNNALLEGNPLVYAGRPTVGTGAHAFNIDGVMNSEYYHLNWGWAGQNNGYYKIDSLKPGKKDFTAQAKTIIGIRPYYYPTGVALTDTLVLLDMPPGQEIGQLSVIDEATDNTYEITLECDSTPSGTKWIPDYSIEGNMLKTARTFTRDDGQVHHVTFAVSDAYGNHIRATRQLLLTESLSVNDLSGHNLLRIYPVPCNDHFLIELFPEVTRITLSNSNGHVIASFRAESECMRIDVSDLPAGVYLVTVTNGRREQISQRIIKI